MPQAQRYVASAVLALKYFGLWYGAYPYPTLTVVDPAPGALGSGGMEYPTFITGGTSFLMQHWPFDKIRAPEGVTVHEFGHQFWYGLVGNNEFEEAWLDEGINSYYESRIMDEAYGKKHSMIDFDGLHAGDVDFARASYVGMTNPKIAPIATPAWKFKGGGYGSLTYQKTATVLTTLERLIGRTAMDSAMKTYFERWKFRHPSGRDFKAVFDEVVPHFHGDRFGSSLSWFFDQMIEGTDVCDYELTSIKTERVLAAAGVFEENGARITRSRASDDDSAAVYRSRVLVSRLGEVQIPLTVAVGFENGEEVVEAWDGRDRYKEFSYVRADKVVWAAVDPDQTLVVDINILNNSKTTRPETFPIRKHVIKMLFWLQNALQFAALGG